MGASFQQTDDAAACSIGGYCSGGSVGSFPVAKKATIGGAAGGSSLQMGGVGPLSSKVALNVELAPAAGNQWKAGNWTVRLNVVAANSKLRWDAVYICRVSSACGGLSTIGSATGLGLSCGSTGVLSTVVAGVAVASPGAGDKIIIVYVLKNNAASGGSQSIYVQMSELIDTPIELGGVLTAAGQAGSALVGRRSWRAAIGAAGHGATTLVGKSTKKVTLTGTGAGAAGFVGRTLRRGVLSAAGAGATALIGDSNKPVLVSGGVGAFAPVLRATGRMALGAAGAGGFAAVGVATVPTAFATAGAGNTNFQGAATAAATLTIDGVAATSFDLTWLGWVQESVEDPPNAGWVMEEAI